MDNYDNWKLQASPCDDDEPIMQDCIICEEWFDELDMYNNNEEVYCCKECTNKHNVEDLLDMENKEEFNKFFNIK